GVDKLLVRERSWREVAVGVRATQSARLVSTVVFSVDQGVVIWRPVDPQHPGYFLECGRKFSRGDAGERIDIDPVAAAVIDAAAVEQDGSRACNRHAVRGCR